eukprot:TRINITY_DN32737_c0_g1_i1.p1 TRINITY_DN32737_c0_g1~~TRINITY_DN32737_c0_g1_i1.p1  ORF type:complete len:2034 (+),score=496.49 TRINITY_DN32737_c0_g1_i1:125-6226(+)
MSPTRSYSSSWLPEQPLSADWVPARQAASVKKLKPLFSGASGHPVEQLPSVVEALLRLQYHGLGLGADIDLSDAKGIRKALRSEPSLAWAEPFTKDLLRIIGTRAAGRGNGMRPLGKSTDSDVASSQQHSQVSMQRICGQGFPPVASGGVNYAAAMCADLSESMAEKSWAAAAKLAGVDFCGHAAAHLTSRLWSLSRSRPKVNCWLMVELCRDCAQHSTCMRHEEKLFWAKFDRMKELVEGAFSDELEVRRILPSSEEDAPEEGAPTVKPPPVRIGAFEVYLCCPTPFVPFGAVSLPAAEDLGFPEDKDGSRQFSVLCLASKLQTLAFPTPQLVLKRLITAMPRVPMSIKVETFLKLPVVGATIEIVTLQLQELVEEDPHGHPDATAGYVRITGKTDGQGNCSLLVPVNLELRVRAWHDACMSMQEQRLRVLGSSQRLAFMAETVVQVWQKEEENALAVFFSSPRRKANPLPPELAKQCQPFRGRLRRRGKADLVPEEDGCLRGGGDLLEEVVAVVCEGWRAQPLHEQAHLVHDSDQVIPVALLPAPEIALSLISGCCGSSLPKAKIVVDGQDVGQTSTSAECVRCCLKFGHHSINVEHAFCTEALQNNVNIRSLSTSLVQSKVSPKRLSFVCVSGWRPKNQHERQRTPANGCADIYLVGGDLETWRAGPWGPPKGAECWLFDGEFNSMAEEPSSSEDGASSVGVGALLVQNGSLADASHATARLADCHCLFSKGLSKPHSHHKRWRVTLHPARPSSSCLMQRLATGGPGVLDGPSLAPSIWLGRMSLVPEVDKVRQKMSRAATDVFSAVRPRGKPACVLLRSTCCGRGFHGAKVSTNGKAAESVQPTGRLRLPEGFELRSGLRLRVEGVPPCLLPGACTEFNVAPHKTTEDGLQFQIDICCMLYVYWLPPEDDSAAMADPERPVWLATDPSHVPEGARPLSGKIRCPGALEPKLIMDGTTIGPFPLRQGTSLVEGSSDEGAEMCPLGRLSVEIEAPLCWAYAQTEPSPLRMQCREAVEKQKSDEVKRLKDLFHKMDDDNSGALTAEEFEGHLNDPDTIEFFERFGLAVGEAWTFFKLLDKDGSGDLDMREFLEGSLAMCNAWGSCQLERMTEGPAVVGTMILLPPPNPTRIHLRLPCCGNCYTGAKIDVDGEAAALDANNEALYEVPHRKPGDRKGEFTITYSDIPANLLPSGKRHTVVKYGDDEPEVLELDVVFSVFVYWIPPEPEDYEDADDGPMGMLWLALDEEQVPDEAQPVAGVLESPGTVQGEVVLDGSSVGPFILRVDKDAEAPDRCLFAALKFHMKPPRGFEYMPRDPTPLSERLEELGGCELTRLVNCPVAVGTFSYLPPSELIASFRSRCCGEICLSASLGVNGGVPTAVDEQGNFSLRRRLRGGEFNIDVEGIPSNMLPGQSSVMHVEYTPTEPKHLGVQMSCSFYIYGVLPPLDAPETASGTLYIAVDKSQIPEQAIPVKGAMKCPGSREQKLPLYGASIGPFEFTPRDLGPDEEFECLFAGLLIKLESPPGFKFKAEDPSPFQENQEDLGGCELIRLMTEPVVLGSFKPLAPVMPKKLMLRTKCCGRSCGEVNGAPPCQISHKEHGPLVVEDDGLFKLPGRERGDRQGTIQVDVSGMPPIMLNESLTTIDVDYSAKENYVKHIDLTCNLWLYATFPDDDMEEEGEDEEPADPSDGLLWLAVDPGHVPEEAKAVSGVVEVPNGEEEALFLDATSTGPFPINLTLLKLEALEHDGRQECLLQNIVFGIQAPEGYTYDTRNPTPLEERALSLGGCEMQRLLNCPMVVGNFKPIIVPPLGVDMRTTCCRKCWPGGALEINGKDDVFLEEDTKLKVKRKVKGGKLNIKVKGVPSYLLPGCRSVQKRDYGPQEPDAFCIDIGCSVYVYWIPPDEEEESMMIENENGEQERYMPEGMVFFASDPEQIPDEAKPVAGKLLCPGSKEASFDLSGANMGPFTLHAQGTGVAETCLLAGLTLTVKAPTGWEYAPKETSPLAERCEEVGGCELERIINSPACIGKMKQKAP